MTFSFGRVLPLDNTNTRVLVKLNPLDMNHQLRHVKNYLN